MGCRMSRRLCKGEKRMQNKRNGMRAVLFTLALALVFAAFAGCSAKVSNPVVGKVGDMEIRFQTYYNIYFNNMYIQSLYGTYDVSTAEKYRAFQDVYKRQVFLYACNLAAEEEPAPSPVPEEEPFVWEPADLSPCGADAANRSAYGMADARRGVIYFQNYPHETLDVYKRQIPTSSWKWVRSISSSSSTR